MFKYDITSHSLVEPFNITLIALMVHVYAIVIKLDPW